MYENLYGAAQSAPAGGAAIDQVIAATSAALLLTVLLVGLGLAHRVGRTQILNRAGAHFERVSGLLGWASLPGALAGISLLLAAIGMYWDISLHVDNGRDDGPLANPSHYFILIGLFGTFAAGWLAIVMPNEKPGPAAVRISRDWWAPASGILLMATASFALLGFPLDDVWHRLFGQDVTLWGPTHIMLIAGAGLSVLGTVGLQVEGRLARSAAGASDTPEVGGRAGDLARRLRLIAAFGGLLLGLSVFQGEFDFGVPQFRLVFHPVLIALSAAMALTAARIVGGRGTAIGAVLFAWVIRGLLALLVGPVLGEATPHFPLYIAEALLVEAVALVVATKRPYRFGLAAGAAIGTLGVLAEWGWSQIWMPLPWPTEMIGEAMLYALPVALAAGVLGAFVGSTLKLQAPSGRALAAAGASLGLIGLVAVVLLQTTVPAGGAQVTLKELGGGDERSVEATVRFDDPSAVEDPYWLTATAWQGGEPFVLDRLEQVGDGVYRTTEPIPVHGSWKSSIRLQRGDTLALIPIYAPNDPAIPVEGIAAPASFQRQFVPDSEFLQRERDDDIAPWLWGTAVMTVVAIWLSVMLLIGWVLARIGAAESPGRGPRQQRAPDLKPSKTPRPA